MTNRKLMTLILTVLLHSTSGRTGDDNDNFPLESVDALRLHNVVAKPVFMKEKMGLRIEAAVERYDPEPGGLAVIMDSQFHNGTIEAEIAGTPAPSARQAARGFVGIAFRVTPDLNGYDAFYLRPTNGRANDQEQRNHAVQYISHPDWPWFRLRQEFPSRYESYVDLVPDEWTKIRIEVMDAQARLYVHGQAQPTLIINDVKSGADATGVVALWIGPGTIAHFRNLKIRRQRELNASGNPSP